MTRDTGVPIMNVTFRHGQVTPKNARQSIRHAVTPAPRRQPYYVNTANIGHWIRHASHEERQYIIVGFEYDEYIRDGDAGY